jgi:uncharacterized membrane protein (DUF373 family)
MASIADRPDTTDGHGHDGHHVTISRRMAHVLFAIIEDLVHLAVALLLAGLAAYVIYHTVDQMVVAGPSYATRTTGAINGALLVVIIVELFQTVVAHFEEGGFQLQPFIIIGIISAVRHILTIGAQLSLGEETGTPFRNTQIELGVSCGVVLALVIALLLVRMSDRPGDAD